MAASTVYLIRVGRKDATYLRPCEGHAYAFSPLKTEASRFLKSEAEARALLLRQQMSEKGYGPDKTGPIFLVPATGGACCSFQA